eukprot:470177-Amphidinium_carterae.2
MVAHGADCFQVCKTTILSSNLFASTAKPVSTMPSGSNNEHRKNSFRGCWLTTSIFQVARFGCSTRRLNYDFSSLSRSAFPSALMGMIGVESLSKVLAHT